MAVNETLSAYSTTAANNTPAGTDTVGPDLDNHLRDIKKNQKVAATHWRATTAENIAGSLRADLSGTAAGSVGLHYQDGTDRIKLFDIDESANTAAVPTANILGGLAGKDILSKTATASVRATLGFGDYTLGGADTAASARASLALTKDAIGGVPGLITGSATTGAALPAVSGEFLSNLNAGSILQFIQAQKTDAELISTASPTVVTDLSAAITLANAANKVKVTAMVSVSDDSGDNNFVALDRGGTLIAVGDAAGSRTRASIVSAASGAGQIWAKTIVWLDTPGSVGPHTYTVKAWSISGTQMQINRSRTDSDTVSFARTVSTLSLEEIKA